MEKKNGKRTRKEIEQEIANDAGLFTKDQVVEVLSQFVKAHKTQGEAAKNLNVTQAYVSDILKGRRNPGPKILIGLGFKRRDIFVPKEVFYEAEESV